MELKRSLNFWDVFSIAMGQVIGSGIMVLIGIGIGFTAYAIPFAFILSATLSIIKQLPIAFMGSAMPVTSSLYNIGVKTDTLFAVYTEWLHLIVRWAHIIFGVAWIGTSFLRFSG